MAGINIWAVLVSAIVAFIFGGVWYSKKVFGEAWLREANVSEAQMQSFHKSRAYIIGFILSVLAAWAMAMLLRSNPSFAHAVKFGFVAGLFFVATSFGINYIFANRSLKLFLIDSGYHLVQFVIYGVILGLWH